MIHQLWGPLINLVGDGGYRAWTIGDWFLMKYSNVVSIIIIAALFFGGMFINLREGKQDSQ